MAFRPGLERVVERLMPEPTEQENVWTFVATGEPGTLKLGQALADALEPGMTVALIGNLGAGKTRLVQAIAQGAGIKRGRVNSPTFSLVQEYEARWPIYHFDTYRLRGTDEFLELGAEEYFAADGICFIEWADRVAEVLPADLLTIEIEITGDTSRTFQFTSSGERSGRTLAALRESRSAGGR